MNPLERDIGFLPGRWVLGLILLAGLLLRLVPIFSESYWLDEVITANAVSMPVKQMIANRLGNHHSPFYFILIYPWARIFGTGEVALRIPSVLASMAALWIFWLLARRFFTRRWQALLAVFLLAISTAAIHYAHEARMYSFVMLATLLSFYFFWRLQEESGAALWAGYGLATLANLYLTVTTLPFIFVQGVWVLARRRRFARFAGCWSLVGFLYLPMAIFYSRLPRLGVTGFLPPVSLKVVANFFRSLWLCPFDNPLVKRFAGVGTLVTILFFILLGAVIRFAWRSRRAADSRAAAWSGETRACGSGIPGANDVISSRAALLSVMWFVLPLGMHVGYAIVRQPVFGMVRYLLGIVPAYILVLVWGAGSFKNSLLKKAMNAILVLAFLFPLPAFFAQSRRPAWRQAYAWIEERAQPRDILTGSKFFDSLYRYYRHDSRFQSRPLYAILAKPQPLAEIWVIVNDVDSQKRPEIEARIKSRFQVLQKRKFSRLTVYQIRSSRGVRHARS